MRRDREYISRTDLIVDSVWVNDTYSAVLAETSSLTEVLGLVGSYEQVEQLKSPFRPTD